MHDVTRYSFHCLSQIVDSERGEGSMSPKIETGAASHPHYDARVARCGSGASDANKVINGDSGS